MWLIVQRSLVAKMDQATLNQGSTAPAPVAILMSATNPFLSVGEFQDQLPAYSNVVTDLFDSDSSWPIPMAAATGQLLKTLAPKSLMWTETSGIDQLLAAYPSEVSPVVISTELTSPIKFTDIEALAPAGKSYVLMVALAAPALEGQHNQPTLLIFF